MLTVPVSTASAAPHTRRSPLQRAVDSGLLRCAVHPAFHGAGGSLEELAHEARRLAHADPEAAQALWMQRLTIEALVQSRNVALREHWLPDLFSGARAGSPALEGAPLNGVDTGRGWLLTGRLDHMANLAWEGFSVLAPARLGDGDTSWVLLRSEEDGLSVDTATTSGPATLHLRNVFFREDEWLGGADLPGRMAPVGRALLPCQPNSHR